MPFISKLGNEVTLQKCIFNNAEMEKVIYNGVEVFSAFNGVIFDNGTYPNSNVISGFVRRWANNYNGGYYGTGVYSGDDYVGVGAASNGGVACTGCDVSSIESFNSKNYSAINFEIQTANFAGGEFAYASVGVSTEATLKSDDGLTRLMTTTNYGWESKRNAYIPIQKNTDYYIHFFCGNNRVSDGGYLNTVIKATKIWLS